MAKSPWLFGQPWFQPQKRKKSSKKPVDGQNTGDKKDFYSGEETPDDLNEKKVPQSPKKAAYPVPAAGEKSWGKLFEQAVALHKKGVDGDKEAVNQAYDLLKKIMNMVPQNHLVEAYFGSVTALQGRDATDPMERFNKAIKGLKMLDQAVLEEPDNTEIRTLRAYVSYQLPETYFHRTATAIEDFSYMVSQYEADPGVFSPEFYHKILYDLGASYKVLEQNQEAEKTWEKLLSQTPNNKYRRLLRQQGMNVPDLLGDQEIKSLPVEKTGDKQEVYQEGISFYNLAISGNKEAAKKAHDYFTKALEEQPDDPLLYAYQADSMSLVGRDASDPADMFGGAIRAMKALDSAVNMDPANVKVRLIRAYHSFRLPEAFFRRTATAISDFEYLSEHCEKQPGALSREEYWQLLYDLGVAYSRMQMEKEADHVWKKLLSLKPGQKYKDRIDHQRGDDLYRTPAKKVALNNRQAYYQEATRLHDLGVAGSKAATAKAVEMWQRAHEADASDAVAKAFYGSSLALLARDSTDTKTIFTNTIKGLKLLNSAIGRDSSNPKIRILRAYLMYSLPESFFQMTEKSIKDFRFLKSAYEMDKSIFDQEMYHRILYDMGVAHERIGEHEKAQKVWSKLLSESEDPKYRELLAGKGVE